MKLIKISILALVILFSACKNEEAKTETSNNPLNPTTSAISVADSIMYIAEVKNSNLEDAYYMDEWLKGAKTEILANKIFKAVFDGDLKAYSYITGEEMTIEEVKELDTEYKRKNIGQILFTEDWYFDEKELKMYKQVNSIMLAYFTFNDEGQIKGNKAGIRVYFNGTKPMKGAIDY